MKEKFFIANIIEASAGTGKTRYITEEMLSIYREYRNPEILKRIVAITFSEKAAIEMKERFLKKFYGEIFSDLSEKEKVEIENVLFKLQISTIHSYCQTLLRRFYFLSDIDPYFEIIEEGESGVLFNRAIYKVLNTKSGRKSFAEISKKFKLNHFKNVLFSFLNAHPHIFLGEPEGEITKKITSFYNIISTQHFFLKKEFSYLDFDDLEKLTYKTLRDNQDALVVLEDFDENINFIFIDEFQDTNLLQFEIVKKLIEEWISGYGAKVDRGENFGIIIVGDRKQSIYKFRGAESKLFDDAKEVLSAYMTEKVLTENYRSSKEIIDFVNNVFENESPWNIQKLIVSEKKFNLPSKIEIKLFDNKNEEEKKNEYKWVCQKIIEIVENKIPVIENDIERTIEFKDIAILLRQRKGKYFKYLERYLSDFGIPYVIIGGVGFYQEEEIIMLTSLLFALVDPEDKFSIWNIKNSILNMDKIEIEKLRQYLGQYNIVEIIENIFKEKNIWEKLNGQQKANCEKFLMILNQQKKLPLFQLTQNLREISERNEEPKADIFSIHQNAVKINTIHGSKGLEFPCVFLINIEDGGSSRKNDEIIYIREKGIYKYSLNIESQENFKDIYKREIKEEEKRLLYVALTRSSQYLFISGQKSKNLWVNMIEKTEEKYKAEEITRKSRKIEKEKIKKEKIEIPIK
ncbi:MAG TPA: UvrD-helicase domain-containing protein, partial [Candidatus Ratteibacteria bacterium]|nr:UvrD-helicase domain-containing protein [Candidatus Ratteibacteria bacterium]